MTADWTLTTPLWRPLLRRGSPRESAGSSWADVVDMDFGPFGDVAAWWAEDVVRQLEQLSYRGRPPLATSVAVDAALRELVDPIWSPSPRPNVSETVDGGVVAEFKAPTGVELQIEWDRGGDATIYVFDGQATEWEGALAEVPDGLRRWAWRVSQSS